MAIAVSLDHPYRTTSELIHCCRKPFTIEPIGDGELWSWGNWSVIINDKNVLEIWIADSLLNEKKAASLH